MSARRGRVGWALVVALVVVPLLEIYVLVQVGQVIGAGWTIVLLIVASILGGWLIRREGARAWRAVRTALDAGRVPTRELADGALVLVGGVLMLTPGFVSDVVGVLLILPITRPLFRGLLTSMVGARVGPVATVRRPGPTGSGPVVPGEVVDDDPRAGGQDVT